MPTDERRKSLTRREKLLIDNIKNVRKSKSLSQEELSYMIDKNSNYMGMVESYRRGISFDTLFKLADALKVKVKTFFEHI